MIKAFHFNKFLFFLKFILIFNMFSIMINNTYTFYMNSPMFVPSYPFDKISRRLLGHLRHRKPFSLYFIFFYDLLFLIDCYTYFLSSFIKLKFLLSLCKMLKVDFQLFILLLNLNFFLIFLNP